MKPDDCFLFYCAVKSFIFFSNPNKFFKPIYKIGKGAYSNVNNFIYNKVLKVISFIDQNMYACKCMEISEEFSEKVNY